MARLKWGIFGTRVARVLGTAAVALAPAIASAQTQNLNLAWNANPESDIANYYVHVGTSSGNYNIAVTPVPANQLTFAFPATPGVKYYFAVKAVNASGLWSPPSSEVVGGVPTFTQPANRSSVVGTAISAVQLSASDPDGGTLQFSATNLPSGLTISSSGRISGTPTTVQTRNVTVSVFDGTVTVQRSFTWTITPGAATVSAVSSSPGTGSGSSGTFALQFTDSLGALDLDTTWAWFNGSFASSAADSCMVYYNRPANLLYLLNDAGVRWDSATLGSSTTLQNGQCSVDLGSSSRTVSGNTLTLNLAMTFTPAFAGAKNIYLYGASSGGANSGWQDRGDWTVPAGSIAVGADSVSPSSGSTASQTFALRYSDTLGASNLATAWVWFSQSFASSAANSCMAYYNRPTNTVFLLNDAGTAWQPATLGSSTTLQNGQCAIALGSSSAALSGTALTVNLAVTFKPGFAGSKNVYLYGADAVGVNSGWHDRGDWAVPSGSVAVTADSATPGSGSGSTQTFALKYSDTLGATDLRQAWVWFNASFGSSAANSCMVYYDRPANTVYLLNNAGTVWQPAVLGSSTTLQNSQCSLAVGSSSAVVSGTTMTLNLRMTFKAAYDGAKNVYMYGDSLSGVNSGWHDRGDWTVP